MAVDAQRIPDDVFDNDRIVVELSIFEGSGNRFSSQFKLCVDRSVVRAQQRAEQIHQYFQSPRRQKRAFVASRKQDAGKTSWLRVNCSGQDIALTFSVGWIDYKPGEVPWIYLS
jgi:hypothetical protein